MVDSTTKDFNASSFYEYLREGKFMGVRCVSCGQLAVEARAICQSCHSTEIVWVEFSGKGQLATFTCISIVPQSMAEKGYGRDNPYCSGIVMLDEGPRISARILNVDTLNPQGIKIGMKMQLQLEDLSEGTPVLAFSPE